VIATDALSSPEVRRLMSVPGVNVITALVLTVRRVGYPFAEDAT
jgi:hypothetical protein